MRLRLLATAILPLACAACGNLMPKGAEPTAYVFAHGAPSLTAVSHRAAATLVRGLPREESGPILVTSLVNVRNLEHSSTLGRVVTEQVATGLSNLGYQVVEARMAHALTINKAGEHILSDEARDLARARKATTVVTGTYGILSNRIYVTVRLIRLSDGFIISSSDFDLPLEREGDVSPTSF